MRREDTSSNQKKKTKKMDAYITNQKQRNRKLLILILSNKALIRWIGRI